MTSEPAANLGLDRSVDGPITQPWRFAARSAPSALPTINLDAFADELNALQGRLRAHIGLADLQHLRKMELWGRGCTLLGYALAWIAINPFAALLLGVGNMARWTMVTHHVMHRGYDRVPGVPPRFQSKHYARGWRRYLDWLDWMHPLAWAHEHNHLHHLHTGEYADPDLVEHNSWILRSEWIPRGLKWLPILVLMCTWKFSYYAPNTWWALTRQRAIRERQMAGADTSDLPTTARVWRLLFPGERALMPFSATALRFYLHCVLPYALIRFGVIPALFLPLGAAAWLAVLINSLIAELVANVHAFVVIVPNHAGDDVYRFDDEVTSKGEFYLRQIVGSVNYPGGSDAADFCMGYLNYQIEHHLWPDMPMLKYRQAAPEVRAICARHGVPYICEPVHTRFARMWAIMIGTRDMLRVPAALAPTTGSPEKRAA